MRRRTFRLLNTCGVFSPRVSAKGDEGEDRTLAVLVAKERSRGW